MHTPTHAKPGSPHTHTHTSRHRGVAETGLTNNSVSRVDLVLGQGVNSLMNIFKKQTNGMQEYVSIPVGKGTFGKVFFFKSQSLFGELFTMQKKQTEKNLTCGQQDRFRS